MINGGLVNQHRLSKLLGRSRTSLVKWAREGMPVAKPGRRGRESLYDPAAVFAWLEQTGRGQRPELQPMPPLKMSTPVPESHAIPADPAPIDVAVPSGAPESPQAKERDFYGYLQARAEREKHQAELARLEVLEKKRLLVKSEDVGRSGHAIGKMFKHRANNVAAGVQALHPGLAPAVIATIERLHREMLTELSDGLARRAKEFGGETPSDE